MSNHFRKHPRFWIGLIAALAVASCGRKPDERTAATPELPPASVRVEMASSKTTRLTEEVVGTVRARLRAALEAKVSGRISEMPIQLGQRVQAGQIMARLDAPEIKARLDQAEARLEEAEREWRRVSALYQRQAATRAEYDGAESRQRAAAAGAGEARAMLGYVEIVAPFDGAITRKLADVGDLAGPGKLLLELEDPARLRLEAEIPESLVARVQPGALLAVRWGDGGDEITARVAELAPWADPTTRTVRAQLDLPEDSSLLSGQFARLLVPVGERVALSVPAEAVVRRGQMEIVFAVKEQRARLHLVKTGRRENGEIEILSGLAPGAAVVIENADQLADGQAVRLP